MEAKKKKSSNQDATKSAGKVVDFIGEVKKEIGRINWTEKEELKAYTKIVTASIFVLGFGIYFVDVGIQFVLSSLSSLVQMITG